MKALTRIARFAAPAVTTLIVVLDSTLLVWQGYERALQLLS